MVSQCGLPLRADGTTIRWRKKPTMRHSVPAVRSVQNGQQIFTGFIPAKVYAALNIRVERFDASKELDDPDQGYQRSPENNRARKFTRYLDQPDAVSPTAILLNDRDD